MSEPDNWDEHWVRFADSNSRNPAQRMRYQLLGRGLLRLPAAARRRILDIGSGQGDFLAGLARTLPEAELTGFELSASGVARARAKVPRAAFFVADLFHPPAEIESCRGWATAAVCSEVLEHVDDPAAFLRAARSYLADGAPLVVTVPGGPMSAFDRHIGHRQHFTRESIRRVLTEGGFATERVDLAGFPFFNLYRAVVVARGQSLVSDVEAGRKGFASRLADAVMTAFRVLFRANLTDAPWGWQVVAVARKQ